MATLIVGFASGMYSSIFTAMPLLVAWEEKQLLYRKPKPAATGNERPAAA
ncbi:MAG: hypothetical protein IPK16_32960 [Anaerolineales bacterium]|nr:hypothetical protein [Anaerolineales bacterium]